MLPTKEDFTLFINTISRMLIEYNNEQHARQMQLFELIDKIYRNTNPSMVNVVPTETKKELPKLPEKVESFVYSLNYISDKYAITKSEKNIISTIINKIEQENAKSGTVRQITG